jgi:catechol 2,3-dioxygenase-like lactoylglutathione lyase family enzyme
MAKSAKAKTTRKRAPKKVPPIPAGHHTVTPYLTVNDGARALEFYARAFGARETARLSTPDGKMMHAQFRIGDSLEWSMATHTEDVPPTRMAERANAAMAQMGRGTP